MTCAPNILGLAMSEKEIQHVSVVAPNIGKLEFFPPSELSHLNISSIHQETVDRVLQTIGAYRSAHRELIKGKYKELYSSELEYLSKQCLILVACCPDGIVVRYDKNEADAVLGGWFPGSLSELVPAISEKYVFCLKEGEQFNPQESEMSFELFTYDDDGSRKTIVEKKVALIGQLPHSATMQPTPWPLRLVNTSDVLWLGVIGVELKNNADVLKDPKEGREFVTKTPVKLKVGWQGIHVYWGFETHLWNPEIAHAWAEQDILLFSTRINLTREKFLALDPLFDARKHLLGLIESFNETINKAEREEDLQEFLKSNPSLLEPAYKKVWPKLPLGSSITDFVFQRATGEYLLVELESPHKKLFTQKGVQTAALTHAMNQILDWRRYIEDNLSTVQRELGLSSITPTPKSLIVIGRSSSLTDENRRKLATLEGQCPNLKIMTYDDLQTNTVKTLENMVGPLKEMPGDTEIFYPSSTSLIWPVEE